MQLRRALLVTALAVVASVLFLAATLEFLAPDVSYRVRDRVAELAISPRGRTFRIALGAASGSNYRVGTVLNRYLRDRAGYELELVASTAPGNAGALRDPRAPVDLAIVTSNDDEAGRVEGVVGVAALETQFFFVIVGRDSAVQDVRDLVGAVNPGARAAGQPPTLGERVLDYYGLASAGAAGEPPRVSIVRPKEGNVADFRSGHMVAATRTQFLDSELVDEMLRDGERRLVAVRDHEALARSLPGTRAGFVPAGLYGPQRREPPAPVPTITVRQLLVARADVPGRVIDDILRVVYDPRFARELRYELSEATGREVGGLALHPAADIFYRRNDLLTSDRLGRISFVASAIAGLVAVLQFVARYRRRERSRGRREHAAVEARRLHALRQQLRTCPALDVDPLLCEADDVLCDAERDAATGLLEADAVESLRSLHAACCRAADHRRRWVDEAGPIAAAGPAAAGPTMPADVGRTAPATGDGHEDSALAHPDRAGAAG